MRAHVLATLLAALVTALAWPVYVAATLAGIRTIPPLSGRMRSAPGGASNTLRRLTHSLDLGKEGLMPQRTRITCAIEGCEKYTRRDGGLCSMHAARKRRHGSATYERPTPTPRLASNGYLRVGHEYVHRTVLMEKVGPGVHPCHWCGMEVSWDRTVGDPAMLVVDHVDADKLNNHPDNLVPACQPCNTTRDGHYKLARTACPKGHEYTDENTYVTPQGHRRCRTCIDSRRKRHAQRQAARSAS